jgi:hypothetical protein
MFSIGFVGAGQFTGQFTELFHKHPEINRWTSGTSSRTVE